MAHNGFVQNQTRRALLLMALAVPLFALMDAGLKLLSPHYPPMQLAALRGLASLPFILVWVMATLGLPALLQARWSLHLLRAVLGIAMMAGFIYGLRTLPLTTTYAITYVAPLLVTAFAVPVLGEKVGPRRWTAIGIGLLGVLVILRPSGEGMFSSAGLAVLLAACCWAASALTVRLLARTDSAQTMVFWLMAMMGVGAGLLAAGQWQALRPADLWLVAGVGLAGSLAQIALTEAFRRGEASLVAPLEYTSLVWAVVLDVTLWGVLPDGVTWVGAAIVVVSGLYLLRRERVRAGASTSAAMETPPP